MVLAGLKSVCLQTLQVFHQSCFCVHAAESVRKQVMSFSCMHITGIAFVGSFLVGVARDAYL